MISTPASVLKILSANTHLTGASQHVLCKKTKTSTGATTTQSVTLCYLSLSILCACAPSLPLQGSMYEAIIVTSLILLLLSWSRRIVQLYGYKTYIPKVTMYTYIFRVHFEKCSLCPVRFLQKDRESNTLWKAFVLKQLALLLKMCAQFIFSSLQLSWR